MFVTGIITTVLIHLSFHGFLKGSALGLKRIFSCHPFKILGGNSGLDIVPEKKDLTKEKINGQ